jgi:hypothetical protein
MIVASKGRLGLVPDHAREGDKVFLLLGGDVPFILRPETKSTWTLIGHCYIHGIMDGEAFKEQECKDVVLE